MTYLFHNKKVWKPWISFLPRTADTQWSLFSWKSQTFGLEQTIWADKLWGTQIEKIFWNLLSPFWSQFSTLTDLNPRFGRLWDMLAIFFVNVRKFVNVIFIMLQKKSFGQNKFLNFMHRFKSAILPELKKKKPGKQN